jgi:sulfite reductase (ferredoxin)
MKSFRTEVENPVVEYDILELERKIFEFKAGKLDEERFRSLQLATAVFVCVF